MWLVSAARWQDQGDIPSSPPLGLSKAVSWWRENRPCLIANSNGQVCPRAAASKSKRQMSEQEKTGGPSGKIHIISIHICVLMSVLYINPEIYL